MEPQELSELPESSPPAAPGAHGSLSISHLPPDVHTRVLARAEVARKAAAEYWAYVEEQDAKEAP